VFADASASTYCQPLLTGSLAFSATAVLPKGMYRIVQRVPRVRTAFGKPGATELLPEKLQKRESPNDRRKLRESICEGPFRL
jgi:hypothetical protein